MASLDWSQCPAVENIPGWDTLRNGELLDAAEAAGFDVVLSTDRNIRHQQNLTGRKIAIVILGKSGHCLPGQAAQLWIARTWAR